HHRVAAELERAQFEAGAGAQRRVEEHQRDRLAPERIAGRALLETRGLREHRVEFGAGPVLGVEEVPGHGFDLRSEGRPAVFSGPETKKPSAKAGFDLELQWRRSGYPASRASGRRAREVMPAAMRAEVRMSALAHGFCIGANRRTRRPAPQAPSAVAGHDRG